MPHNILIEPRDPLIFRDARPAEASLPIRSLDWPLPSSVIGAIRTRLGRLTGYDAEAIERLKIIEHVGPLLAIRKNDGWELAFPAPADAVLFPGISGAEVVSLRPRAIDATANEGCDIPHGLSPLFGSRDLKPLPGPRFWTSCATLEWLADRTPDAKRLGPRFSAAAEILDWLVNPVPEAKPRGRVNFLRQRRIHLEIEPKTFAAKEGRLFTTEGLEFAWIDDDGETQSGAICSQIRTTDNTWAPLEALAPLGGERRLAYWSEPDIQWPEPPPELASADLIRLQLITPAAFENGWKPGWLNDANCGSPPEHPDLILELVSAAVPRPVPHSGWDLTKPARKAQKPARFLAPAGSVYFFKASRKIDARPLWLRSICDDPQDRRDGFGVVLCGGWKWQSE
jgi:CRISPR-associated protein Cmr3